jgi:hypothetical protein
MGYIVIFFICVKQRYLRFIYVVTSIVTSSEVPDMVVSASRGEFNILKWAMNY